MTWFRVDDDWHSHPKILGLTLQARGLWITTGTWCAAHLTDGYVQAAALPVITGATRATCAHLADELVTAGLWDRADDVGYWFHDWREYQPTREAVAAKRAAEAERLRKWREKNRQNGRGT